MWLQCVSTCVCTYVQYVAVYLYMHVRACCVCVVGGYRIYFKCMRVFVSHNCETSETFLPHKNCTLHFCD